MALWGIQLLNSLWRIVNFICNRLPLSLSDQVGEGESEEPSVLPAKPFDEIRVSDLIKGKLAKRDDKPPELETAFAHNSKRARRHIRILKEIDKPALLAEPGIADQLNVAELEVLASLQAGGWVTELIKLYAHQEEKDTLALQITLFPYIHLRILLLVVLFFASHLPKNGLLSGAKSFAKGVTNMISGKLSHAAVYCFSLTLPPLTPVLAAFLAAAGLASVAALPDTGASWAGLINGLPLAVRTKMQQAFGEFLVGGACLVVMYIGGASLA